MNEFQHMRHQLLKRLTAGEIDREEYEWMLTEVRTHENELTHSINLDAGRASPKDGIQPGITLGTYTIKRLIGKGGMGEVWLAEEVVRDNSFFSVIKPLLPPNAKDEEANRLLSIFHKVRLLQHEHICPVYSIGYDEHVGYYFVMKYIEGITLAARAADAESPLSVQDSLEILRAVAKALDYAHGRGIIHRDVKPANIMVSEELKEVHVVDFGLAARLNSLTSTIKGSPGYMAPEQWMPDVQDGRTDQFALAIVAYELISGQRPFSSAESSIGQLMSLAVIPKIETASRSVNEVLGQGLAKNRADRFASCLEFVENLDRALKTTRFDLRQN